MVVAAPWVLAAVLAGLGVWSRTTARDAATTTVLDAPPVAATPAVTAAPTDPAPVATTPSRPAEPQPLVLPPAVELAVVAAARATFGSAGLLNATGDGADRWPLQASVVAVEAVTDALGVATVHGLVIEHTGDGWGVPRTLAAAVPLSLGEEVVVTGPAWPLSPPPTPTGQLSATPVEDPDPALVEVLLDLGWEVERVTAVDLAGGGVLRLRLHGTAPGGRAAGPHEVWLLDAPGGVRPLPLSLPSPPTTATDPPPTDARPTEDPA